jgi:hypothetical protein
MILLLPIYHGTRDPIPVDEPCPVCGGPMGLYHNSEGVSSERPWHISPDGHGFYVTSPLLHGMFVGPGACIEPWDLEAEGRLK